jgi:hypothetical protein
MLSTHQLINYIYIDIYIDYIRCFINRLKYICRTVALLYMYRLCVFAFFVSCLVNNIDTVSSFTLTFKIKSSNCSEAIRTLECPDFVAAKYNSNVKMGTMALCEVEGNSESFCTCRDPFIGEHCTHVLSDDTSATIAYTLYYIFIVPSMLYVTLSSWLVLIKKVSKRNNINNMRAMRLMRENSQNSVLWQKKTSWACCSCGLTVSAAIYLTLCTTLFFCRNVVDPFYLRGLFSKNVGYFLTTTSHMFGLIAFVQLFGAYTKLTLRTGSPNIDKKCGKKARKWLPRYIRRICVILLFVQEVHQFFDTIGLYGSDNWYIYNSVSLGVIVLIFSTFTLYYGMSLIKKVVRLKTLLDSRDGAKMIKHVSSMSSIGTSIDENDGNTNGLENDDSVSLDAKVDLDDAACSADASNVIRSKRFYFITVMMKHYLIMMGTSGYCVFIFAMLHTFGPNDKYFYIFTTIGLDVSIVVMGYTLVRLLEATAVSELYTKGRSKCKKCLKVSEEAVAEDNAANVETINEAYGVEIHNVKASVAE